MCNTATLGVHCDSDHPTPSEHSISSHFDQPFKHIHIRVSEFEKVEIHALDSMSFRSALRLWGTIISCVRGTNRLHHKPRCSQLFESSLAFAEPLCECRVVYCSFWKKRKHIRWHFELNWIREMTFFSNYSHFPTVTIPLSPCFLSLLDAKSHAHTPVWTMLSFAVSSWNQISCCRGEGNKTVTLHQIFSYFSKKKFHAPSKVKGNSWTNLFLKKPVFLAPEWKKTVAIMFCHFG